MQSAYHFADTAQYLPQKVLLHLLLSTDQQKLQEIKNSAIKHH